MRSLAAEGMTTAIIAENAPTAFFDNEQMDWAQHLVSQIP
jgi:hypothetical protein